MALFLSNEELQYAHGNVECTNHTCNCIDQQAPSYTEKYRDIVGDIAGAPRIVKGR